MHMFTEHPDREPDRQLAVTDQHPEAGSVGLSSWAARPEAASVQKPSVHGSHQAQGRARPTL